jgi:uncharacterized protein with HEPN domain
MANDVFIDIRNSSAADIRHFIENNFSDANYSSDTGYTLLHCATQSAGNAEVIKVLISMGADVNAKTKENITPLHNAAVCGYLDAINVLLSHNANIEAKEEYGHTPLLGAVVRGNVEAAKVLVKRGADVYAKNNAGKTALFLAKQNGDTAMIQYLSSIGEGFINILKKIVEKHGKGPLLDIEICRAYVADYARRDYKEESLWLFMAVEAGVTKEILGWGYAMLSDCLKDQHKKLQEMGMETEKSMFIVDVLGQVMWGVPFNG